MWEAIYSLPCAPWQTIPEACFQTGFAPKMCSSFKLSQQRCLSRSPKVDHSIDIQKTERYDCEERGELISYPAWKGNPKTFSNFIVIYYLMSQIQRHEDSLVWRLLLPSHSSIRDESFCHCQSSGLSQVLAHITKQHCHVATAS